MMLAGAEAIAARAQFPGKGGNTVSLKNCQIQFIWDGYLLHAYNLEALAICDYIKNVGFEHRFFSYKQCLLKKIYLSNKARSTIRHTFTKEKFSDNSGSRGPLGPSLNPPLS